MTTNISRIEIFCDDNKVGSIQRMLAGVGIISVTAQPVTNAKVRGGKIAAESGGDLNSMFKVWAKRKKLTGITNDDARAFLRDAGRSENSYGNFVAKAIKLGVLKKPAKGGPKRGKVYPIAKK